MAVRDKERKKLTIPSCPDEKSDEGHYSVNTLEEKIVHDYVGYDFGRIQELDIFNFWLLLRDATIYNCQQTDEGKDYLDRCWVAEQTEPDRRALRKYFQKG